MVLDGERLGETEGVQVKGAQGNIWLVGVEGSVVGEARSFAGAADEARILMGSGVKKEDVCIMGLTRDALRFRPSSRSASILQYLSLTGVAGSIHSFVGAIAPYSTRYHYESIKRLTRAGLVAVEYTPGGQSRAVKITEAGEALLAYWGWRGWV